ncbi:MAG: hypothetical protein KatS3mg122_1067 [Caldimonas sp.]|nr:MAG: hypothetical protein KatS3mg122_1067 [Caldimonas sp.]
MQSAAQPDIEKVHQVGVRDGIVVRRIRNDYVQITMHTGGSALIQSLRLPPFRPCYNKVISNTRHPLDSTLKVSACFTKRAAFNEVPGNRQCESRERVT